MSSITIVGEKGDKGDVGPQGPPGINGIDGTIGVDGKIGKTPIDEVFKVTVAPDMCGNNKFYIDGSPQKTIDLFRGHIYIFDQTDSSNLNANGQLFHPLKLSSTDDRVESVVDFSSNWTQEENGSYMFEFQVPNDAPDILYYRCENHIRMGGILHIVSFKPESVYSVESLRQYLVKNEYKYAKYPMNQINIAESSNAIIEWGDQLYGDDLITKPNNTNFSLSKGIWNIKATILMENQGNGTRKIEVQFKDNAGDIIVSGIHAVSAGEFSESFVMQHILEVNDQNDPFEFYVQGYVSSAASTINLKTGNILFERIKDPDPIPLTNYALPNQYYKVHDDVQAIQNYLVNNDYKYATFTHDNIDNVYHYRTNYRSYPPSVVEVKQLSGEENLVIYSKTTVTYDNENDNVTVPDCHVFSIGSGIWEVELNFTYYDSNTEYSQLQMIVNNTVVQEHNAGGYNDKVSKNTSHYINRVVEVERGTTSEIFFVLFRNSTVNTITHLRDSIIRFTRIKSPDPFPLTIGALPTEYTAIQSDLQNIRNYLEHPNKTIVNMRDNAKVTPSVSTEYVIPFGNSSSWPNVDTSIVEYSTSTKEFTINESCNITVMVEAQVGNNNSSGSHVNVKIYHKRGTTTVNHYWQAKTIPNVNSSQQEYIYLNLDEEFDVLADDKIYITSVSTVYYDIHFRHIKIKKNHISEHKIDQIPDKLFENKLEKQITYLKHIVGSIKIFERQNQMGFDGRGTSTMLRISNNADAVKMDFDNDRYFKYDLDISFDTAGKLFTINTPGIYKVKGRIVFYNDVNTEIYTVFAKPSEIISTTIGQFRYVNAVNYNMHFKNNQYRNQIDINDVIEVTDSTNNQYGLYIASRNGHTDIGYASVEFELVSLAELDEIQDLSTIDTVWQRQKDTLIQENKLLNNRILQLENEVRGSRKVAYFQGKEERINYHHSQRYYPVYIAKYIPDGINTTDWFILPVMTNDFNHNFTKYAFRYKGIYKLTFQITIQMDSSQRSNDAKFYLRSQVPSEFNTSYESGTVIDVSKEDYITTGGQSFEHLTMVSIYNCTDANIGNYIYYNYYRYSTTVPYYYTESPKLIVEQISSDPNNYYEMKSV